MAARHRSLPPWIRLAGDYTDDPRIRRLDVAAELLFVRHLALPRRLRTDGHLTTKQLEMVTHGMTGRTAQRGLEALISEGLLEPCADGIRVPFERWARWQDTQEELDALREAGRQRQTRHRNQPPKDPPD